EQCGSILGSVDGVDVTIEHVAAMHEGELLKLDYLQATDKFRRVSQLKKVLERRPPIRRKPQLVRSPAPATAAAGKQNPAPGTKPTAIAARRPVLDVKAMRSAVTPQQISAEE